MSYGEFWRMGEKAEAVVRSYFTKAGWFVIPTCAIHDGGAPKLAGQIKSYVLPDFAVTREGFMRWVEVKGKTRPVLYQRTGRFRHGVDLDHWYDYLRVEHESGQPGYLAIVQLTAGVDAPRDPMLLMASFDALRGGVQLAPVPTASARNGMAYFDADLFERFPIAKDVGDMTTIQPRKVHPWELRRRMGPRQSSFDLGSFD